MPVRSDYSINLKAGAFLGLAFKIHWSPLPVLPLPCRVPIITIQTWQISFNAPGMEASLTIASFISGASKHV